MGEESSSSAGPDRRIVFDPALKGRRVQADGGSEVLEPGHGGIPHASRATFEGVLTGRRLEDGDPPWRWLEITDLTDKPEDFEGNTVWCEESYVYFLDE